MPGKELGKLMNDFVLGKALSERVKTVQAEITKLRQIVVGTSQILCVPVKNVSIPYRSWPDNNLQHRRYSTGPLPRRFLLQKHLR